MKHLHTPLTDYIFEIFPFEFSHWPNQVLHQTANILFAKNICPAKNLFINKCLTTHRQRRRQR